MICSSISPTLPRVWAIAATVCARSPLRRAASRSSEISRLICTKFLFQSARTPSSSRWISSISSAFASCSAVLSADLLVKLPDALPELRLLAEPGTTSQLEQLTFALDGSGGIGLVHAGQQSSREDDLLDLIALASQPGLARGHLVEALGDDSEIGSRNGPAAP